MKRPLDFARVLFRAVAAGLRPFYLGLTGDKAFVRFVFFFFSPDASFQTTRGIRFLVGDNTIPVKLFENKSNIQQTSTKLDDNYLERIKVVVKLLEGLSL